MLALHRARSILVRQRTATVNAIRGLLGEFGIVVAKGISRLDDLRRRVAETPGEMLPEEAKVAIRALFDQVDALTRQAESIETEIAEWHRDCEASQRLAAIPGVGVLTATALVAAVGDGRQFHSARHFAAWLGLTPKMQASGNRQWIGGISKGGDRYLRTLLIHGARAPVGATKRPNVPVRPWLVALIARRPIPVAAKAVAHKTARAIWAMLTRAKAYRPPAVRAA